ncbi:ATPase [Nitratireductor aestuarii]|uniref:ATPase n=1 Tax=Nitratireductor aestuarii TaxID=1735103 RepID=A0A916VYN1_9HYPH|nr:AAA family ATPase [Nitratireductor aestuarii]GGA52947.1 ATPase [Nitratireductor aestuarii]
MKRTAADRLILLTGGPGSGKTTLLDALASEGYRVAPEAGRAIIRDQLAIGGQALPWKDAALFAEQMLQWDLRSHAEACAVEAYTFFDRGVPDIVGYLRLSGLPMPEHVTRAAERCRYWQKAFILPPWPEIFTQDAERRQDLEEAMRTNDAMVTAYSDLGYELVEVPRASIEERAAFVLRGSASRSASQSAARRRPAQPRP